MAIAVISCQEEKLKLKLQSAKRTTAKAKIKVKKSAGKPLFQNLFTDS